MSTSHQVIGQFLVETYLALLSLAFVLVACTSAPNNAFAPTRDSRFIFTTTVYTQVMEIAADQTPIAEPFPASMPVLTPSTFPPKIASLLSTKCQKFGETIYNYFISSYGDKGCKLPVISPNEEYLAYVTLIRQENEEGVYYADVVRIMKVGTDGTENEAHIVHKMDYVVTLEWSPTGQLIIWEYIWEGPKVIFVYDPVKDTILTKMRASQDGILQWSPPHTAFYAWRAGDGYGADVCVGELGGYDFETGSRFPDFYKIFNIQETGDDPLGIPYGKTDNLYIEPFGWSLDGKRLWVTVTPLHWEGDQANRYKLEPRQAGMLDLSTSGIIYRPLAADPHFDYSFEGLSNPKIVSKVYEPRLCP